jgi:hypothetical protein
VLTNFQKLTVFATLWEILQRALATFENSITTIIQQTKNNNRSSDQNVMDNLPSKESCPLKGKPFCLTIEEIKI